MNEPRSCADMVWWRGIAHSSLKHFGQQAVRLDHLISGSFMTGFEIDKRKNGVMLGGGVGELSV